MSESVLTAARHSSQHLPDFNDCIVICVWHCVKAMTSSLRPSIRKKLPIKFLFTRLTPAKHNYSQATDELTAAPSPTARVGRALLHPRPSVSATPNGTRKGGALPCRLCRPAPARHQSRTRPRSFSYTHTHTHCYTCLRIPSHGCRHTHTFFSSVVHTVRLQLVGSLLALFLRSGQGLTDLCTRSSVFISASVGVWVILVVTVRFSMRMRGQV